jgi:hypothetical protein
MRAPRGADSKRDATTNPNPDFIQHSNFLVMPSDAPTGSAQFFPLTPGQCHLWGEQEKDELEVVHRLHRQSSESFLAIPEASVANMCMEFWHEYIARTLQVRRCTAPFSRLMVGTLARSGGRLGWIHTADVTRGAWNSKNLSWQSRRLRWRICAWNFGTNTSLAPFRFAAAQLPSRA